MSFRDPKPLPDDVIDRLFSALTVRYGAAFLDRWRDLDLAVVKGDWARQLAGFASNLGALRYALDQCGEKPPTVIDFRKAAQGAPWSGMPALGHSSAPTRGPTAEEREDLAALRTWFVNPPRPNRDWAHRMIAKAAADPRSVHSLPLRMAHAAIGSRIALDPVDFDNAA